MSGVPHVSYTARPDATPEGELTVLADVFRYVLDCRRKKNAAGVTSTNGGEPKGSRNDRPTEPKYT